MAAPPMEAQEIVPEDAHGLKFPWQKRHLNKYLDTNLFIYVLLLFIWTSSCLNTSQSNESSTKGAKHGELMQTKLDNFRLIIIIGIMIIGFGFTCSYVIHYNCMSDNACKDLT
ncbi:uncharacterized protein CXorf66 homolog [Manis javanica]|uniref:uncharacterized protein CXorf66 homolog n=1 Tax=Manis javanica TaxID=9974 RepID=UPI003C6D8804